MSAEPYAPSLESRCAKSSAMNLFDRTDTRSSGSATHIGSQLSRWEVLISCYRIRCLSSGAEDVSCWLPEIALELQSYADDVRGVIIVEVPVSTEDDHLSYPKTYRTIISRK